MKGKNMSFRWCLHCERTYKRGEFRFVDGGEFCPYEDCDGHIFVDGWPWVKVRKANPQYPEIPEPGKVYSLYS